MSKLHEYMSTYVFYEYKNSYFPFKIDSLLYMWSRTTNRKKITNRFDEKKNNVLALVINNTGRGHTVNFKDIKILVTTTNVTEQGMY